MKINELKDLRIQTLASYDLDTKIFSYAVENIDTDNIDIITKEILNTNEFSKPAIRRVFVLKLSGYIISDEPDTIPDYKTLKISYSETEELEDNGNIELNKVLNVKLADLPKDAKNHFLKQLKEIQKSFDKKMVNIKKECLPIISGIVQYDNYTDNSISTYEVFSEAK